MQKLHISLNRDIQHLIFQDDFLEKKASTRGRIIFHRDEKRSLIFFAELGESKYRVNLWGIK